MTHRYKSEKNWLVRYSELLGVWVKRASNPQDAEDAVQDSALRMLEKDGAVLKDASRYFQRMAINRSISIYRSEQVRMTQEWDEVLEESYPAVPSSHAEYEAHEMAKIMLRALAELPSSCQTAFRLRQVEGLTNKEIAQKMGVSLNMVERYMMRTIRHLQDQI